MNSTESPTLNAGWRRNGQRHCWYCGLRRGCNTKYCGMAGVWKTDERFPTAAHDDGGVDGDSDNQNCEYNGHDHGHDHDHTIYDDDDNDDQDNNRDGKSNSNSDISDDDDDDAGNFASYLQHYNILISL